MAADEVPRLRGSQHPQNSRPRGRGAGAHLLLAVVALVLIVACFYAVKTLSLFVSPMLFLAAIFLEVVFLAVFVYAVARALSKPSVMLRSLGVSAWTGLESNEYVVRFRTSDSPWVRWLRNRLRTDIPDGLWLTGTVVVAAIPLVNFISLAINVAAHGPLTEVDRRIANLMPTVRTAGETSFFSSVTVLANAQILILVVAVAAVVHTSGFGAQTIPPLTGDPSGKPLPASMTASNSPEPRNCPPITSIPISMPNALSSSTRLGTPMTSLPSPDRRWATTAAETSSSPTEGLSSFPSIEPLNRGHNWGLGHETAAAPEAPRPMRGFATGQCEGIIL
nr:hypothetical protein [Sinomonas gamaensis]